MYNWAQVSIRKVIVGKEVYYEAGVAEMTRVCSNHVCEYYNM